MSSYESAESFCSFALSLSCWILVASYASR